MAVKRKKIVEDTQMFIMLIFKQKNSRGSPTKLLIRSETASEVRNMFVSDLNALFLQIKKITSPFATTINEQMKDKSTIIEAERSIGSSCRDPVSLLDPLHRARELELLGLRDLSDGWAITSIQQFVLQFGGECRPQFQYFNAEQWFFSPVSKKKSKMAII